MILSCPACEQTYFADDESIGSEGRNVTCASCGHEWFERPSGTPPGDEALARGAHERYLEAVRLRRKRRSRLTAIAVWAIMLTLFTGGLASAVIWRDDVVRHWPESASTYARLGLDVNRFGVEFENIERSRELRGTVPVLTVSADIRNVSAHTREAPAVRVGLLDDFGREIAHIFAEVTPARIAPGEAGRFSAVVENPPPDSYRLDLRFLPAGAVPPAQEMRAEAAPEP